MKLINNGRPKDLDLRTNVKLSFSPLYLTGNARFSPLLSLPFQLIGSGVIYVKCPEADNYETRAALWKVQGTALQDRV